MTDPSQIGRKPRPANADRPPRSPLGELLTPTPDELAILRGETRIDAARLIGREGA